MTWFVFYRVGPQSKEVVATFETLEEALSAAAPNARRYYTLRFNDGSDQWLSFAQANHLAHYGTVWGEFKLQPDGSII